MATKIEIVNEALQKVGMITPERMAASNTEHGHQTALMIWVSQNLSKYPELQWLTAIPNGGLRNAAVANKLKAEGVKPGLPDLLLAVRRGSFSCLWIEMKRSTTDKQKRGVISSEQIIWSNQLLKCHHWVAVCYGWEQARDVILGYLRYETK